MTVILPDSRLQRNKTNQVCRNGIWHERIFCAQCGADGGLVPVENMTFAFYLCNPCHEAMGDIPETYAMPDEVFWQKVRDAQVEQFGRVLTPEELAKELDDGDSLLSKLAREKPGA